MHKCLSCKRTYDDDAPELVNGCVCGSKYFLYYKDKSAKEEKREEIAEIEKDILDIIKAHKPQGKEVVVFDIESVVIPKHGKYILNLERLFKEKAIVFKIKEGRYVIDFSKLRSARDARK